MSTRLRIFDLQIDDANENEAWRHGVTPREMRQVLDGEPQFFPNKKKHGATHIMIGQTYGGRLLTIPILKTLEDGIWRPATAFEADADERASYNAARRSQRRRRKSR